MSIKFKGEDILKAYRAGFFPMAQDIEKDPIFFDQPLNRALLSIKNIHIPKRLLRTLKQNPYDVRINMDFEQVVNKCASPNVMRDGNWINQTIKDLFNNLHDMGYAHSVECWQDDKLVGGLYGLSIGKVFCGESMFSDAQDASKIALIHLCARLDSGDFNTLDAQYENPHLAQFGLDTIPHDTYMKKLMKERDEPADFIQENDTQNEILDAYLLRRGLITAPASLRR